MGNVSLGNILCPRPLATAIRAGPELGFQMSGWRPLPACKFFHPQNLLTSSFYMRRAFFLGTPKVVVISHIHPNLPLLFAKHV